MRIHGKHFSRVLAVAPLGLGLCLMPTAAHACTGEGMFVFLGLVPYVMLFPIALLLKAAMYALAGEGWTFKALAKGAALPVVTGAVAAVVRLPSMPYFVVALIAIFTIFAMADLKYFRAKYEGRPPMRVRHALFWGNLLATLMLLGGLGFFSAALQGGC